MNGQLPSHPAAALTFIRHLLPEWAEHREAIGVSESALAAAQQTLTVAEEARLRAEQLRQEARAATNAYHRAAAAARKAASIVVMQAQAQALVTEDEVVYTLAGLRVPAKRPGAEALANRRPSKPTNVRASLCALTGDITVAWEGRQMRGIENVTYEIRRSLNGSSIARALPIGFTGATPAESVGGSVVLGSRRTGRPFKSFVDRRVPVGVESVTYFVVPRIGGRAGPPSDALTVRMGSAQRAAAPTGTPRLAAA
ncbi:MAG: hypothetical protein KF768_06490 [Phycisphaeraceae bacterium]|nr:hypothetical protein [Phycisphaeraceae bacterium]